LGNSPQGTANRFKAAGITIWLIVNGKIAEEWSQFDQLRIMEDGGLLPASAK
jgi:hypothetical protein